MSSIDPIEFLFSPPSTFSVCLLTINITPERSTTYLSQPWDLDEALRRRLEKRLYVPLPEVLVFDR
jgi:hypothetical protein